jgi:hypothetical protein
MWPRGAAAIVMGLRKFFPQKLSKRKTQANRARHTRAYALFMRKRGVSRRMYIIIHTYMTHVRATTRRRLSYIVTVTTAMVYVCVVAYLLVVYNRCNKITKKSMPCLSVAICHMADGYLSRLSIVGYAAMQ